MDTSLNALLTGPLIELAAQDVLLSLSATLIASLAIAWAYKKTHRGLSYSQSLINSLVIVSLVVTLLMLIIGNNLIFAFGAIGAFSIIRFRSAIKDPKDMAFIFLALTNGIAMGTQSYEVGGVAVGFILVVILGLHWTNFGAYKKMDFIVSFYVDEAKYKTEVFEETFRKFLKNSTLLNLSTRKNGKAFELTYNVDFKSLKEKEQFVKKLSHLEGVSKVGLIACKHNIEY